MNIDSLYDQVLSHMESTVHDLAQRVAQPKRVPHKESFVYRHIEKTRYQAIVQKLARLVSSLHATRLLMQHGFVQEQAAMQRILDEIQEDITFLSFGIIFNKWTTLHDQYLQDFFEEEFDSDSTLDSSQKRKMIPRKKIRGWISSIEGGLDPSTAAKVGRTISKTYSGYVHAASPHIMDMYSNNPPQFMLKGMIGTLIHREHRADLWNYFYRGILTFAFAAKAFGDENLFNLIKDSANKFAQSSGKDYLSNEWDYLDKSS